MKANLLSSLGRVSYSTHIAMYPLIFGSLYYVYGAYNSAYEVKAKELRVEALPQLKKVDPDMFQPFSPIPYHNNPEVHYRFAKYKMHNYVDGKTHMNTNDYVFKNFTDSYDHGNKKVYLYNWTSMYPSDHK